MQKCMKIRGEGKREKQGDGKRQKRFEENGGMAMGKLFDYADKYLEKSSWKDFAIIKVCLFSMGILAGMRIPERNRKRAGSIAAIVFLVTYIPLMAKFFAVVMEEEQ